jgi:hypothetical protein
VAERSGYQSRFGEIRFDTIIPPREPATNLPNLELKAKDLESTFTGVRLRPLKEFPWGRELHIIDPGGVCWHVRQSAMRGRTCHFTWASQVPCWPGNTLTEQM